MKKKFILAFMLMFTLTTLLSGCGTTVATPAGGADSKAAAGGAQKAQWIIKFGHGAEATEPTGIAALQLAKNVSDRTNGKLQIQVFASSQLGNEKDMIESVKSGSIQMTHVSPGSIGNFQPQFQILNGPFLFKDWNEAKKVLSGPFGQELDKKLLDTTGIRVLDSNWYWGWRDITANKPIKSPADAKGLKIRAPNIPIFVETFKAMGASPTPIDLAEVYTSLQQGVADAQENPIPTIYAKKFYEVQKYVMISNHMLQSNYVLINNKFFESLPADIQKILQEEVIKAGETAAQLQQKAEKDNLEKMKASGVKIVEDVDRDAFQKATESVYAKFEGQWGQGLYQKLQDAKK